MKNTINYKGRKITYRPSKKTDEKKIFLRDAADLPSKPEHENMFVRAIAFYLMHNHHCKSVRIVDIFGDIYYFNRRYYKKNIL